MKYSITAIAALVSAVSAHSWVECANHDNSQLVPWMEGNSTLSPPVIIDPEMPWYSDFCHGWPRNKANPGNWIEESTDYIWGIGQESWNGGAFHPPDTHACNPDQRTPTYQSNAPMTTAAPGSMIRLRYGGNGHTRGYNAGFASGPGNVSVYWKGAPEMEITDISEFTPENLLQTGGFADHAFAYPADKSITTPDQGLVDKGNWMELNLPADMAPGRHMMVWVWYFNSNGYGPQFSTCLDVMVQDGATNPLPPYSYPAGSSPAAPVASSKPASSAAAALPASSVASVAAASPAASSAVAPAQFQAAESVSASAAPVAKPATTEPPSNVVVDEVYTTTTVVEWTTTTVTPENDMANWKGKRAHPRAF